MKICLNNTYKYYLISNYIKNNEQNHYKQDNDIQSYFVKMPAKL